MVTATLAAGGIVMPPESVIKPLASLLGVFMWFVTAALIAAGYLAGVEIAAKYKEGEGLGPGSARLIAIVVGAIATSTATAWGGWLLI